MITSISQPIFPTPTITGTTDRRPLWTVVFLVFVLVMTSGCSVRKFAANRVGNVLAETGTVYASDDDIELIGDALPFGLKTMEGLLTEVPDHHGLLVAAASGFTQYAYAYVDFQAFELEETDRRRARELRQRAKRLYLRGRDYALRALDLREPDLVEKLRQDPTSALARFKPKHVPELYWAAVSWSAAISADKQDMDLVADLNLIGPLIQRCLELDESFNQGAIHQFLIAFEGGRSSAQGGSVEKAREHFQRAMELANDQQVSPLVSLAESVSVQMQNRREFKTLLQQALGFNADKAPEYRLANLIAQRRAQVLMFRIDDFFIGE
ncbi:MAG: TRAP transporter TatT component family protein [Acidiferrobacterales bacterium]